MKTEQNNIIGSGDNINQYCLETCYLLPVSGDQVDLIEVSSQQSLPEQNNTIKTSTVVGVIIIIMLAWAGIISWLKISKINKELRNHSNANFLDNPNKPFNNFNSIPCTKCKFFHNNSHLKCAVNPSKVLQPEAKECLDYSRRPPKKILGLDKLINNNKNLR
jgi:hypothetical protein